MPNGIIFAKWDSTPSGLVQNTHFTTKYYDLGTSSNKIVFLKLVLNIIAAANSNCLINVYYRTDAISSFLFFGSGKISRSTSNAGTTIEIQKAAALGQDTFINDVPGIQFKINMLAQNDVAINDIHFIYRKKRTYNVEETE